MISVERLRLCVSFSNEPGQGQGQRGLSLTELMVAMTLSVLIINSALGFLLSSRSQFILSRELAELQENARFILRLLGTELRQAGFSGCARRGEGQLRHLVQGGSEDWHLAPPGLTVFPASAGPGATPGAFRAEAVSYSDVLIMGRGAGDEIYLSAAGPEEGRLRVPEQGLLRTGDIALLSSPDCHQLGIAQLTGSASSSGSVQWWLHETGVKPGNCGLVLGGDGDCAALPSPVNDSALYPAGSRLQRLHIAAYYVAESSSEAGLPALFVDVPLFNSTQRRRYTAAQELVQGVEAIAVELAQRDATGQLVFQETSSGPAGEGGLAVRLHLRLRSLHPVYPREQTFPAFLERPGTERRDRYLRRDFSTIIAIRN